MTLEYMYHHKEDFSDYCIHKLSLSALNLPLSTHIITRMLYIDS